jgi:hypothetical protein
MNDPSMAPSSATLLVFQNRSVDHSQRQAAIITAAVVEREWDRRDCFCDPICQPGVTRSRSAHGFILGGCCSEGVRRPQRSTGR